MIEASFRTAQQRHSGSLHVAELYAAAYDIEKGFQWLESEIAQKHVCLLGAVPQDRWRSADPRELFTSAFHRFNIINAAPSIFFIRVSSRAG